MKNYDLKLGDRDIADEINNNEVLQDGVSYSTDMFGNLVVVVSLNHEHWNTIKKIATVMHEYSQANTRTYY
jgi:hypothetical protein